MNARKNFAQITAAIDPVSGLYVARRSSVDESSTVKGLPRIKGNTFEEFMLAASQAVVERTLGLEKLYIRRPGGAVVTVDLRVEADRPKVA